MSLLFNMLSRLVMVFFCCFVVVVVVFPKEQASSNFRAVIIVNSDFEARDNKICHYLYFFPSICHEVMGPDAMMLVF